MTHFAKMICISIAITKKIYMLACLLMLAMASVSVDYVQMLTKQSIFSVDLA